MGAGEASGPLGIDLSDSDSPLAANRASIEDAFRRIDANGDGVLSRIEVIKACRANEDIRALLGLPKVIRQEDGTRDAFEAVFQAVDGDGSKGIDEEEFVGYFGRAAPPAVALAPAVAQEFFAPAPHAQRRLQMS